MEEKRRFVRLNTNVEVKLTKIGKISKEDLDKVAASRNISENGICIIMQGKVINAGDKLNLEIELPTQKIIKVEGIVMWVNEFEIFGGEHEKRFDAGIEFLKINDNDQEAIKDFVFKSFRQKIGKSNRE